MAGSTTCRPVGNVGGSHARQSSLWWRGSEWTQLLLCTRHINRERMCARMCVCALQAQTTGWQSVMKDRRDYRQQPTSGCQVAAERGPQSWKTGRRPRRPRYSAFLLGPKPLTWGLTRCWQTGKPLLENELLSRFFFFFSWIFFLNTQQGDIKRERRLGSLLSRRMNNQNISKI